MYVWVYIIISISRRLWRWQLTHSRLI
jgi:protocatechuate 3,4-dioxygenase beta subunit